MLEIFLQYFDVTSILIVAIFSVFLEYRPPWWWRKQSVACAKSVEAIPGPLPLPIFGTKWLFTFGFYNFNRIHEFYEDMYKKYGPVVKEEALFNVPVINLFEKRDIEKIFKSNSKYPLRPPTEALALYRKSRPDRYASVGIVNEQGEAWHLLRSSITSTITSTRTISNFVPQLEEIADDFYNLLKTLRNENDEIPNINEIGDRLGLELTCALVLGRRMGFLLPGYESEVGKKFARAINRHFLATRDTYFGLPIWKYFPTRTYKQMVESEEEIYNLALELIQSADDSTKDSEVFQSVLKADIDEREKTATIIDFLAAGVHTLKNSLVFLLHLIAENPRVQDEILNDPTKAYSKACMYESFRLYPTANSLARIIQEEIELGGFRVKPGSVVVCHNGVACKDERNFKQAKEFRPERWIKEEEKYDTINNATHLFAPFGVGRRICPGKRFVEQVLPIILDCTIKNFQITVDKPLELEFEFIIAPKSPVPMIFKNRY